MCLIYSTHCICNLLQNLNSVLFSTLPLSEDVWVWSLKGLFWYLAHWAPFLGCPGCNGVVDTEILTIGPVLGYLAHLESAVPASEWLATGIHKPALKTPLNVCFQKLASHPVVSGVHWCSKSSITAKYSFWRVFICHFVNPIDFCWRTHCSLTGNRTGCCLRLVLVFSLCSPSQQ